MLFHSIVAAGLLAVAAAAPAPADVTGLDAAVPEAYRLAARTVDCQFMITADDNATCLEFASEWGLSVAQFQALNPTASCPDLEPDTPYCVLGTVTGASSTTGIAPNHSPTTVSYTLPTSTGGPSSLDIPFPSHTTTSTTSTTTKTTSTTSTTSTGGPPAPTQAGLASNCNKFYQVVKSDSCTSIETKYGLLAADFLSWNPALQSNCLGLLTGYYVCVDVPGATTTYKPTTSTSTTSTTTKPTTTTTSKTSTTTTTSSGTAVPSPLQPGTFDNCTTYHLVVAGDTCGAIETAAGISSAQFATWNSGVDAGCTNIGVGNYLCVGGGGGAVSTIPSPLQPGTFNNCTGYHLVVAGDSCSAIETAAGISAAQFATWNSGVSADCTNILVGDYLCIAGGGGAVSTTPSPLQPGTQSNCTTYHKVVTGDTCAAIETSAGISASQFSAWNTGVDADCTNIQVGYYLCIAGGTGGSSSSAPSPLQPGTISTCTKYHLVASGDTCASIESSAGISAANFATWNPDVNSACSNIQLGYYVCIGA